MAVIFTSRQIIFIEGIVLGKSGHDAAEGAGYAYPDPEASRLLVNPKIAAEIAKRRAAVATRVEKSAADIARAMWQIINDPKAPHSAKVSAAALEAKRYQEYSDKREVKSLSLNIDVEMGKDIDDGGN